MIFNGGQSCRVMDMNFLGGYTVSILWFPQWCQQNPMLLWNLHGFRMHRVWRNTLPSNPSFLLTAVKDEPPLSWICCLWHSYRFCIVLSGMFWNVSLSTEHSESYLTIHSWSRFRTSLRLKQLDTKLFHWRTIHGRLLTMVLQTMRLDSSLYSWTFDETSASQSCANTIQQWGKWGEYFFFSVNNPRKSNGNLLFRHLIHPRWKGGFNPAGTGPVCWACWMSCTRCGIDSIYILCNVTGKESFKESNRM